MEFMGDDGPLVLQRLLNHSMQLATKGRRSAMRSTSRSLWCGTMMRPWSLSAHMRHTRWHSRGSAVTRRVARDAVAMLATRREE